MKPMHHTAMSRRKPSTETLRDVIKSDGDRGAVARHSVYGRPRALTLEQVARVLRWHDSRMTLRELARELSVSTSTITLIIKSRGSHYKQAPPEQRAASLMAHRERCSQLKAANLL